MLETKKKFSFLNFVRYKSMLDGWSAYALLGDTLQYNEKYPLQVIGSFLTRNKTEVKIKDNLTYKRPTIKLYNQGIQLRDIEKGTNIGTKNQFLIKEGQFLLSKIDARNGAFGVVPQECVEAIITGNFWTFDVDYEKINPHYLALVTSSKQFHKYCQSASVGTTGRHYLQEELFLKIKIPLPSISEQQILVDSYNKAISEAKKAEEKAVDVQDKAQIAFKQTLGILEVKNEFPKGLQFIRLSSLMRWDFWNFSKTEHKSDLELVSIKDIIRLGSGSFLPTKNQIKDGEYLVYGGNGITGKHNNYNFEGKRLVIGRVGEYCGNVHLVEGKYWITDNAFWTEKISDEFSWEYLEVALKTLNLNRFRVLSAQPSISQGIIYEQRIPKLNIAQQEEIVKLHIDSSIEICRLKRQSNELRTKAKEQFEMELFEA